MNTRFVLVMDQEQFAKFNAILLFGRSLAHVIMYKKLAWNAFSSIKKKKIEIVCIE